MTSIGKDLHADRKCLVYMPNIRTTVHFGNRTMNCFWCVMTRHPAYKGLSAFSLSIKWKMSNIQMSELSGKVSKEQQHVIPTVLDRSSGICVHEEACLALVLFQGRYHDNNYLFLSFYILQTFLPSHTLEKRNWCVCKITPCCWTWLM